MSPHYKQNCALNYIRRTTAADQREDNGVAALRDPLFKRDAEKVEKLQQRATKVSNTHTLCREAEEAGHGKFGEEETTG